MITRFVEIDGAMTRCLLAGEEAAPPLLLVHGLSLTAEIWLRNIDVFARDFRVVAVDMLGHGFTRPSPGDEGIGVGEKVAHLRKLADRLGFDRFAINGSSYGALVAANLYLADPTRITKLVIAGSGSCFNTETQLVGFVERIYAAYKPTLSASTPEMWRERLTGTFFNPAAIPPEVAWILPLSYAQPWTVTCWEATIAAMRDPAQFRPFRIMERLEDIAVETLVVWGREDRGGILESAVAAVGRMPHAKLLVFDRCGHLPMVEHPDAYNRAVRDFLLPAQTGAATSKEVPEA